MKVSTQGQSRFLSREDIPQPFVATIDHVTEDKALRNPFIVHFLDDQLKPFPLNVTNRRVIVGAFGDESDNWHGRQVEIYFDASVPNPRDPSRPGGIKVRIPARQQTSGSRQQAANVTQTNAQPQRRTAAENLTLAFAGLERAKTQAKCDEWAVWWKKLSDTTPDMDDDFADRYHVALERISGKTPELVGADIPF